MGERKAGGRVSRFTVSLPDTLMRTLDRLQSGRAYSNRSEFVRDLLRAELVKEEWQEETGETVGVLVLVYDHDTRALADKLTDIQHEHHGMISAALHGYRLGEVPTTMRDRGDHATGTKKGGNFGYGVRFARAAVHTWRRDRRAARTRERPANTHLS